MSQSTKIREEESSFEPGAFEFMYDPRDVSGSGRLKTVGQGLAASTIILAWSQSKVNDRANRVSVYLSERPVPEVRNYIRSGFNPAEWSFTARLLALSQKELADNVDISVRSIQRKLKENERLSSEVSDRLFRLQKVSSAALDLFEGNVESMRRWLKTPLPVLDGETPLAYSDTEPGAQFVLDLINRLEHGVFS